LEIKKSFETSFKELGKHKVIVFPVLLSIFIPIILTLIYVDISGLREVMQTSFEKSDVNNVNDNSQSDKLYNLITVENIILLIIFVFIGIISLIYLTCATFSLITLNICKKDLNFYDMIKLTNKYLFRYISLNILYALIIIIPTLLVFLVAFLIFSTQKVLGIFSAVIAVILLLVYMIYIGLRLFFSTPILFIEKKSASQSLLYSFHITKGHLKQVFIIYTIILGISLLSGQISGNPIQSSIIEYFKSENVFKSIFMIFLIAIFVLIEAIVVALEQLFFFYSYVDFRRIIK